MGDRLRWLDGITDSMDMNLSKFWEIVEDRGVWRAEVHGVTRVGHDLATKPPPPKHLFLSELGVRVVMSSSHVWM